MGTKKKSKKNIKKSTKFKIWCIKQGITQRQIHKDTCLSIGTIHSMWHKGKANASSIKLISLVYKLTDDSTKKMISLFEDID